MVQHYNKLQNCLVFYDSMFWYPDWLQFSFDLDYVTSGSGSGEDSDLAGSKVSGSG